MRKSAGYFLVCVVFFCASGKCFAQHKGDSASSGFQFELSLAGQTPTGELGKLFGFDANVGGGIYYRTESNWMYGASFSYLFGNQLRDQGVLDSIATNNSNLIANDGNYPGVTYFERGFDIQLTIGRLFPISKNRNSGILFTLSAGYLQYHLRIEAPSDWTPQISGDYLQGYEHLNAGICATEFLGYQYISKKQFLAFFGGFEFTEAMAKILQFDFQSETKDPSYKFSLLSSIRVGWILPILQDNSKKITFYTH